MSVTGQPIEIKDINVTYISTKTDKFDNTICYFKVADFKAKKKLKPILSEKCDECRLPLWENEDGECLIKVKQRYAPTLLVPDTTLNVKLTFKYYCMNKDDTLLQGYYAMVKVTNKSNNEDEN